MGGKRKRRDKVLDTPLPPAPLPRPTGEEEEPSGEGSTDSGPWCVAGKYASPLRGKSQGGRKKERKKKRYVDAISFLLTDFAT